MIAYKQIEKIFTTIYRYQHVMALADWDSRVMMPDNAADARGAALAQMEQLTHNIITSAEVKNLIETAQKEVDTLAPMEKANLREVIRLWENENLIPEEFVQRKSLLTTKAQVTWRKCRENNDFKEFLPTLKQLIELAREEGKYRAGKSGKAPYEALVDMYEPGMTLKRLDAIFQNLKSWLPDLLKEVLQKRKAVDATIVPLKPPFAVDRQEALCREMMKTWKFDFEGGRLDVSAHPFCGNVKEDVRITTNYHESDFEKSLYGVIHETGHAKYEQNCGPRDMITQPICNARSLGIHESQSLFAEMMLARSLPFLEFLTPKLTEFLGKQEGFTYENVAKVVRKVEPGHIRIDADELCYPLHVILRYEIEKALMEGTLEAENVPEAWNEKMKAYLGIDTTGDHKRGCLQDVHWSGGLFGYFPTYTLGAIFAAQLMASIKKELGEDVVSESIRRGELDKIFEKQKEKIWKHGSSLLTDELITQATGETLNPEYYRAHLIARYRDDKF